MRPNYTVSNTLEKLEKNQLFIASKLYKEKIYDQISEAAYYKTLQRMCEAGELVKIAKGTYYLPKTNRYGIVPPSEKDIISMFIEREGGTVVGYSLYNKLNLTTQVPKNIIVMSSALEGMTKSIRNVTIHHVPLNFSKEVVSIIHGLEVLQNFYSIQDMNYNAFIKYTAKLAESYNTPVLEKIISVRSYKKSTISFLKNILDYYHVENNLSDYLSTLSVYKHPRMEELYEAARASQ